MDISIAVFASSNCGSGSCPAVLSDMFSKIPTVILLLEYFSVIAVFIMLIKGGIQFMVSGGDKKSIEAGKNSLIFSVIGFVIIFLSFLVINLVHNYTAESAFQITSSGAIEANTVSSFTATPLPFYLISTITPPPLPYSVNISGAFQKPSAQPSTADVPHSCGGNVSYCINGNYTSYPTNPSYTTTDCILYGEYNCSESDYTSYTSNCIGCYSFESSLASVLNGYFTYKGLNTKITIEKILKLDTADSNTSFTGDYQTMLNDIMENSSYDTQYIKNFKSYVYNINNISDATDIGGIISEDLPAHGMPVILELNNGEYITVTNYDYSTNQFTITDPDRLIKQNNTGSDPKITIGLKRLESFNPSRVIVIMPSTGNDYINTVWGQLDGETSSTYPMIASCLILHESGFNPGAINNNNNDGFVDVGLMQIDNVHFGSNISTFIENQINENSNLYTDQSVVNKMKEDINITSGTLTYNDLLNYPLFNIMAGLYVFDSQGFQAWSTEKYCW